MLIQKGNKNGKTVTCKIKFIDMTRFVVSSLSISGNNHAEGLHRYKCENFKSDFEYAAVKDITPIFKCVECHKTPEKEFDKSVTKDSKTHIDSVTDT